eukprot:scaffold31513_cov30-Phaeocystis_antarctica.AAC.1
MDGRAPSAVVHRGSAQASSFPHDPAPAPLSQVASEQQPERQLALAARAAHRADIPEGGERAQKVATCRGRARFALAALCVRLCSPPMIPLRRPSRRNLNGNDLDGSVPSQLGNLPALAQL